MLQSENRIYGSVRIWRPQAERRVVATSEPQYPRLALCGSLPALVAHLSEHKLAAVRAVLARAAPAR